MTDSTGVVAGGGGESPGRSLSLDAPASTESYEAFKLEQRGIELIPESDRKMRPAGLFWMWAGAIWNVEFLVYGALMVYFGLSFWQAVLAILVGNLATSFLGLARAFPGPRPARPRSWSAGLRSAATATALLRLFNWITQVGFEIEGIVLIVLIIEAMFSREGTTLNDAAKVVVIICAVAVQFIAALPRPRDHHQGSALPVVRVHRRVRHHGGPRHPARPPVTSLHQHASWWIWTTGLVLIVSAGGLGWTENAADYSRYLPAGHAQGRRPSGPRRSVRRSPRSCSSCWARRLSREPEGHRSSAGRARRAFASWFFWPFLILALPQLFAINTIDMYSSGVTLQAIGIPLKRWGCVLVDTVISGGVTALVIFKGNFYTDLSGFLDYIVVWLGPWFGILMADYLLRRGTTTTSFRSRQARADCTGAMAASTGRRSSPWRSACSRP